MTTYTREQILSMPAGPELDELVMKVVFKAHKEYYGEDQLWYHYDENGNPDYEWNLYNSPSTNIHAAWEVLEQFKIHQVTFSETGFSHSNMGYRVILGKNQNVSYADTAPEAITKAAILAMLEQSGGTGDE